MISNAEQIHQLCQQLDKFKPEQVVKELSGYKWFRRTIERRIRNHVNKNSEKYTEEFVNNNLFGLCIPLVLEFGFGQKRLNRFLRAYRHYIVEIKSEYQEDIDGTPDYCETILRRHGINTQELIDCLCKSDSEVHNG